MHVLVKGPTRRPKDQRGDFPSVAVSNRLVKKELEPLFSVTALPSAFAKAMVTLESQGPGGATAVQGEVPFASSG